MESSRNNFEGLTSKTTFHLICRDVIKEMVAKFKEEIYLVCNNVLYRYNPHRENLTVHVKECEV